MPYNDYKAVEKQKQLFIKQSTKMHTEAHYFAMKVGLNSTHKERKYNKEWGSLQGPGVGEMSKN